jgi:hypothetical protein
MTTEFDLERVKKLVQSNNILRGAYERTTRRSNRRDASYQAIFNALIKNDKGFMELYEKTV